MQDPFNIVSSFGIINEIKFGSKYFRVNLGFASTLENQSGDRTLSDKDEFSYFYNTQYKTTIYAQGLIGNISFYTDHYIKEDVLAVYYDHEEFVVKYDRNIVKEKGVDAMLGSLLRTVKEDYENRQIEIENKKKEDIERKKQGNASVINLNPGSVTYADLKEYLEKKRSGEI